MRILLTGATGYIGKRILPVLLEEGHEIWCCVRDPKRFVPPKHSSGEVHTLTIDFLKSHALGEEVPKQFDVAYYLMHSLASKVNAFEDLEEKVVNNFLKAVEGKGLKQIIYLSGMVNNEELSVHLRSRLKVEEMLNSGKTPVTTLRAGIIVGSGSASFEIIRDLVEKLPVMVAPRWLETRIQPIAIRDVIDLLDRVKGKEQFYGQHFDIGGPDALTYKQMLLIYSEVRGLKRYIFTLPVMTPRLSSYWLYFVTSTSYPLAVNLVNSMKIDVVCQDRKLQEELGQEGIPYKEAVEMAFQRIKQNVVTSSWKDAAVSSKTSMQVNQFIEVPEYGCFKDYQEETVASGQRDRVLKNLWSIGGDRGWYYGTALWKIRGFIDKLVGGVGLRRGRTSPTKIEAGDALDFWRVLAADREEGRLLLYAEMKLPGQAWLEFQYEEKEGAPDRLTQTATFRPSGVAGRLYWYAVLPFHSFIFKGMLRNMIRYQPRTDRSSKIE